MFKGLEHTAIASPNPEALAKWYEKHLEFHINFSYNGNFFVKAQNGTSTWNAVGLPYGSLTRAWSR